MNYEGVENSLFLAFNFGKHIEIVSNWWKIYSGGNFTVLLISDLWGAQQIRNCSLRLCCFFFQEQSTLSEFELSSNVLANEVNIIRSAIYRIWHAMHAQLKGNSGIIIPI